MTVSVTDVEEVGRAPEVAPDHFRPFVAVCAFAGLRSGEAAGLRLQDVDFLRRAVSVGHQLQGATSSTVELMPPQYGSQRVVPVPDELVAMLAEYVRTTGIGPGDWLVSRDGSPHNRNSAGHRWRQVRRAAGMEDCTLHDLRHFYASGLIAAGCDVVTVQRALGHSAASITLDVYSHLWPTAEDRTRAAACQLMESAARAAADPVRTSQGYGGLNCGNAPGQR